MEAQSLDEGDAPLLALAGDMNWTEAKALVESLPKRLAESVQPSKLPVPVAAAAPAASPTPEPRLPAPAQAPAVAANSNAPAWPWIAGSVVLVVIAFLIWSRRK